MASSSQLSAISRQLQTLRLPALVAAENVGTVKLVGGAWMLMDFADG